MTMNVYLSSTSTKPLVPDSTNTVDVFGALGGSPAFVGFSAPEPATYGILGLGLAALGLIRRRSQRR